MATKKIFAALLVKLLCASPLVMGGEYKTACTSSPCPSVTWLEASAGQVTNFTLQGPMKTTVNNYVAFAFATGQKMGDAMLVVDCYDISGTAMMATSRNTMTYSNTLSPTDDMKVSNRNANRNQGTLTCSFSMALPNSAAYILISEGQMDVSTTPPVKTHHNNRYPSSSTFNFDAPTTPQGAVSVSTPMTPAGTFSLSTSTALAEASNSTMSTKLPKNRANVPGIRFEVIALASITAYAWMITCIQEA